MRVITYFDHVLVFLVCGSLLSSLSSHNCHLLDRSGRRCGNGPLVSTRNGHQPVDNSENRPDSEVGHYNDRYNLHSRPPSIDRLTHKKGNLTRLDSWPGQSLNANTSWNSLNNRATRNQVYELTTEPTTTEATDDIERFLVGKRRKRNALWMNPNLYYNRAIGNSLSGSGNDDDEEDIDEEINHGHNSESRASSAVTRQVVHERSSNSGSGNHNVVGHTSGHGVGYGAGSSHNNRTPFFFMPRANPLLKLKLV